MESPRTRLYSVLTLLPDMFDSFQQHGVVGRAFEQNHVQLSTVNPRDFTQDNYHRVDDRPFGGGPGMIMLLEPLEKALTYAQSLHQTPAHVIYLTPQGKPLLQKRVRELADLNDLILVAGRYEGIDERFIDRHVDEEISIGDYVLSGGEVAAMVLLDAVIRLIPGVLGHNDSADQDSFGAEGWLDCPHYTRPEIYQGIGVPDVLLSGHHANIQRWRRMQSIGRTLIRRADLLDSCSLSGEDLKLLQVFLAQQNDP